MAAGNHFDPAQQRGFASTHWTTVRACAGGDEAASAARERLCRDYWYPLYAYIKRSGLHDNDAEDLTQDFFVHILKRSWFRHADPERGKFRSFLLTSLNNFLRDHHDRKNTRKRGGGIRYVPLDMGGVDSRYSQSAAVCLEPTEIYEVEWTSTVVAIALKCLENEYVLADKHSVFLCLKGFLAVEGTGAAYEEAAQRLETSPANIKAGVHRMRKRYGAILHEEVARTVGAPSEIEGEMRYLREVLAKT